MKYDDIRQFRTVVSDDNPNCNRWHESVMRSYQILEKVKALLQTGSSAEIILEIIQMLETPLDKVEKLVQ